MKRQHRHPDRSPALNRHLLKFACLGWAASIGLLFGAEPAAVDLLPLRQALQELSDGSRSPAPEAKALAARFDALAARASAASGLTAAGLSNEVAGLQREILLAHPAVSSQPVLFVARQQYRPDHHNTATFFPAALYEYNDGAFTPGSALKSIDLRAGGRVRTLLDVPNGVLRDPDVHFDGRRVLFSMRTNQADSYHLYEMRTDGTALRQLTFGRDVDDLDPIYLPDDTIVFSSTREPKYCACNRHIMANLFRMEADGANIHQIGKSTLFEGHASVLPDGRLLYDRWEYVDRNFGDAQALWTTNPDGTAHAVYWGNNTAAPGAVIDGRAIPGTDRVLCVFGSCHDRPWGALAIVDRRKAVDGREGVVRTWPANATELVQQNGWEKFDAFTGVRPKYEDPYPLTDRLFLCSRMTGPGEQMGLYLLDIYGNEALLHAEAPGCFDPMPLGPRRRPPVIPSRRDFENGEGTVYVQDVYRGTHMAGVKRGAVKSLRVIESPEKRFWTRPAWGGQGQEAPAMNWHDFGNKRILGSVPVESDGSAYFRVPADVFVYFQLLDENGMMVQSMRSGMIVQSGEHSGCVGCHEDRRTAPPTSFTGLALQRAPSQLTGWHGPPREFSYLRDVQPVFDKHCVRCHDFGAPGAQKLLLVSDRDLVFNASYNELWRKQYVKVVGAGPPEIQAAYSWGAHASKLGQTLLARYRDQLTPEEFDRVVTWLDLNAPYYPTYACAYPDNLAGRCPLDDKQLARLEELTGMPLRQLASHQGNRGPQVSFDRPERSLCLNSLKDPESAAYQEALAIIRSGQQRLATRPEADREGFTACEIDLWRDQKYAVRRELEIGNRAAIRQGQRRYETGDSTVAVRPASPASR